MARPAGCQESTGTITWLPGETVILPWTSLKPEKHQVHFLIIGRNHMTLRENTEVRVLRTV